MLSSAGECSSCKISPYHVNVACNSPKDTSYMAFPNVLYQRTIFRVYNSMEHPGRCSNKLCCSSGTPANLQRERERLPLTLCQFHFHRISHFTWILPVFESQLLNTPSQVTLGIWCVSASFFSSAKLGLQSVLHQRVFIKIKCVLFCKQFKTVPSTCKHYISVC